MTTPDIHSRLERLLGPRRAFSDPALLEPFACDESGLGSFPPDAVALVESAEEIREVLRFCQMDRVPVVPRGAGTGMSGGALAAQGGVVLSTERMTAVLEVDEGSFLAVVQPGLITGQFQQDMLERGLFYPPDPASLDSCSLGGNVAENAGGPSAFKYGVTGQYVLGLEVSLMGGQTLGLGRRTVKGVTGLDLTSLMVGSEGVLGVISEITLRLLPRPEQVSTFLAQFDDPFVASEAVTRLIQAGYQPRTLEFLDTNVLDHLRRKGGWPIPADARALLLIELDGRAEVVEQQLLEAATACEGWGATDILVATDEARRRQMWEMRRSVSPTLREQHLHKVSEDVAVPRAHIPELVRRLDALAASYRITVASYGHAGDGNLHVNILWDDEERGEQVPALVEELFRETLKLGGTLSGEHGIGLAKRPYIHLEQPPELLAFQKEIKRTFDPENLMNPGKIFPGKIC